jgi:hypothetical protein
MNAASIKVSISHIDVTYNSNLPDECDWFLSHCMAISNVGLDHLSKGLLGTLKQIVASPQYINARTGTANSSNQFHTFMLVFALLYILVS